jgi:phage terminase large subunit-like protein
VFSRSIVYPDTRSSFKVLSADVRGKHGPNIQCLIFDELHVQTDRELFETLEKGIAARRQPLIVMITTAGDDEESICYEQHEYAEDIIKNGGDDTFLPVLFTTPKEADWTDPKVWAAVNPGLGKTVKLEFLENEVRAALKEPRKVNSIKRLHLNIWTQQKTLWIPIENWDACKRDFELGDLKSLPFAMGLDLSSKIDLTSLVLAFRVDDKPEEKSLDLEIDYSPDDPDIVTSIPGEIIETEFGVKKKFKINFSVILVPYFWMPEGALTERKKKDRFGYAPSDELAFTEGGIIDYDAIYDKITIELAKTFDVKSAEVGYDPWNATQLTSQLKKDGFKTIEIPQTFRHLSEPSKVFEALVKAGRIHHAGTRVMRWNVENVAVVEDRDQNIRPVKSSKTKRIDGVVAAIDALSCLLTRPPQTGITAFWL